jgi:threonine dehydratase
MVGSNSDIRLVRHGNDCSIAEAEARKQAEETSKIYLSPYNDADVVSGQGTIGIEILEQMKEVSPDNSEYHALEKINSSQPTLILYL